MSIWEIIAENFPNLVNKTDIQFQGAQGLPNKMSPKRLTLKHIIGKISKVYLDKRILKAARKK